MATALGIRRRNFPRPVWPYAINYTSWESQGLVFWVPFQKNAKRDLITGASLIGANLGAVPDNWLNRGSSIGPMMRPPTAGSFIGLPNRRPFNFGTTGGPLTTSFWLLPENISDGASIVSGPGNITFSGTGGALSFARVYATTNAVRISSTLIPVGQLAHVVFVDELLSAGGATTMHIYINGIESGYSTTTNGSGAATTVVSNITFQNSITGGALYGFADFRVYKYAMNANQVYRLYSNATAWELYQTPQRKWFDVSSGNVFSITPSGVWTPSGSLVKDDAKRFAGTWTPAATVAKSDAKPLAGAWTPAGSLAKNAGKSLAGVLTSAGAIVRSCGKGLAGAWTPAGALVKACAKVVSGAFTPAGTVARSVIKAASGAFTPAGTMTKACARALAGTLAPTGSLAKSIGKAVVGSLTSSGALAKLRVVLLTLTAALAPTGALVKSTAKSLAGSIAPSAILIRTVAKALAGALTMAGDLVGEFIHLVLGDLVTTASAFYRRSATTLESTVTRSTTLSAATFARTRTIASGVYARTRSTVSATIRRVFTTFNAER